LINKTLYKLLVLLLAKLNLLTLTAKLFKQQLMLLSPLLIMLV
jgi:hypothetical protein